MPAAQLEIEGLCAGYGPTRIIEDIAFTVRAGERLAVLGRNGMGKTTLLATLMGLSSYHTGRIPIDEQDITHQRTSMRARHGFGYVPQTRDIFPSLTVEENLRTGLKGRPPSATEEAYAQFPRLRERRRIWVSNSPVASSRCCPSRGHCSADPRSFSWTSRWKGLLP